MHSFPQFTHSTRRGKFYRGWAIFWGAVFLGGNFPWEQFSGGGGRGRAGGQWSGRQFSSVAIIRGAIFLGGNCPDTVGNLSYISYFSVSNVCTSKNLSQQKQLQLRLHPQLFHWVNISLNR